MATSKTSQQAATNGYWKANLRVVIPLLLVWFLVGYVLSILLIEPLNSFSVGQLGFGFWMAQQGSIFVFVAIVWFYAIWMGRVDRQHSTYEETTPDGAGEGAQDA